MLAFNDTWRDTRALLLAAWIGMSAIPEGVAQEITPSLRAVPSALLSIDQNRGTVVERIVADWGEALTKSTAGITIDQLRSTLLSMRSDYLLAASVAGSLEGLRSVVASSFIGAAPVSEKTGTKALGDGAEDLVYTPVTPCRLADTRLAGGQIGANSSRDFKVWGSAGTFTAQGGSPTNCNIPANPAAVVVDLAAVTPAGAGNFIVYPTGTPTFTSVINYQSGQLALANGAIVPVCQPGCANHITIATNGAGADLVIDISGYFMPPLATAVHCNQVISASTAIAVSSDTLVPLPNCAAGFTRTGNNCAGPANTPSGYLVETNITGCLFRNLSSVTTYNATATSTCCQIPGR